MRVQVSETYFKMFLKIILDKPKKYILIGTILIESKTISFGLISSHYIIMEWRDGVLLDFILYTIYFTRKVQP